ncbi:homoserine O-acetyltransferase [Polychytrium aggregatum]|uniref:homoserine O-acetyltransferase n=1 Tax=Polychytrium aggregatum TaxID=110093 RepID=UPI0022FDCD7D|nr:homoserine O-acetyltransferase [Polychytrium aggregatum]KAI9206951.1 homoserine O-acetyltransferase [Polychytrium aggregatum]
MSLRQLLQSSLPRATAGLHRPLKSQAFALRNVACSLYHSSSALREAASKPPSAGAPAPLHTSIHSYSPFAQYSREATEKQSSESGPEPNYDKVVSGYEVYHYKREFKLEHGGVLPEFKIAYETWGRLNPLRDNVILLHTGLSASSHAKSHPKNPAPGWWEKFIGPQSAIDTDKWFVICTNVIGGCYGSTGPSSIDPASGQRYATNFPLVTISDMVRAQLELLDHLGIQRVHASVGASMGGMQSLAIAAEAPHRIGRVITISAAARTHPYAIAMRHVQRQVLMADPNWKHGFYYDSVPPHVGMKLAREIGTITYRSGPEWEQRFGRKRAKPEEMPVLCPDFLIESYLDHQGEKFCLNYDANSLLYISKAMDLFDMSGYAPKKEEEVSDPTEESKEPPKEVAPVHISHRTNIRGRLNTKTHRFSTDEPELDVLIEGLAKIQVPTLVLGVQSDILFPVTQQKEIADCLRAGGNNNVTYYELDALYGHDTFLIDLPNVGAAVKGHLESKFGSEWVYII